jgi:endonuclease/exonuclease/phosphatase family metal-dependent hydrolase
VQLTGKPWLEILYTVEIDREPYFATFEHKGKQFTLGNFHAITKKMQPETEIKYFRFLPAEYPDKNLIFAGDFNCPQSHTVFNPLKSMGYKPVFSGRKTSLKHECIIDNCLASEFDNMFYNAFKIDSLNSGTILFYESFPTLKAAGSISDHIPVWFQFNIR